MGVRGVPTKVRINRHLPKDQPPPRHRDSYVLQELLSGGVQSRHRPLLAQDGRGPALGECSLGLDTDILWRP
eukprot:85471-Pyramimonas_sp.AAC.1